MYTAIPDRGLRPSTEYGTITSMTGGATIGEGLADAERMAAIDARLMALEADFFDERGRSLDGASRDGFYAFMRHAPWLKKPSLGAESDGKIVATWDLGDECLTLRFYRYDLDYAISSGVGPERWGRSHSLYFLAEHPKAKRIATR